MKRPARPMIDHVSPRQQHNWDWRAAGNFIAGGAGGGLLLCAWLVNLPPQATRIAVLLGLVLVGSGLTCVWFEIGRPWRALNVYRHFATSWMTREAVTALFLFASGGLALLTLQPAVLSLAGIFGLIYVYCQANMLAANKGIPAWRHPRSVPLMMTTGVAEGAGFLACIMSLTNAAAGHWPLAGLMLLILLRAWLWKRFVAGLAAGAAPDGTLKVLNGINARLLSLGHVLPLIALAAAVAGVPGQAAWVLLAGIAVVASGWWLKFNLVRRAAFTQGLALLHLPVRGQGVAGPAVKPGWKAVPGQGLVE